MCTGNPSNSGSGFVSPLLKPGIILTRQQANEMFRPSRMENYITPSPAPVAQQTQTNAPARISNLLIPTGNVRSK